MNDDCCFPPRNSQSWIDLQHAKPVDILNLIADAYIGSTAGAFANSSNYGTPGSWATNSFTITSAPTCAALGTDNLAKVADSAQWNFSHSTANIASTNAIPLRKVIFLRAGLQFQMSIPVSFGASTYSDIQLSFLDNAATRGDAQGTVPVIQWTGSFTGDITLKVTLKTPGKYTMGLRAVTGGNTSMFEMEWIVVADAPMDLLIDSLITQPLGYSGTGDAPVAFPSMTDWNTCFCASNPTGTCPNGSRRCYTFGPDRPILANPGNGGGLPAGVILSQIAQGINNGNPPPPPRPSC